jgi:hypothetical protein
MHHADIRIVRSLAVIDESRADDPPSPDQTERRCKVTHSAVACSPDDSDGWMKT